MKWYAKRKLNQKDYGIRLGKNSVVISKEKELDGNAETPDEKSTENSDGKIMRKKKQNQMPSIPELEKELKRERYNRRYRRTLRSTIYTLITVAATAILVATLWLPMLEIYGNSMTPTLNDGEIVLSWKTNKLKSGQIVAFYYNNKILVKRVIAQSGDWVNIDVDGTVYVNGQMLNEPYLEDKALGECDIELPYQVPEKRVFVMGDHRSTSIDSRNTAVGCVEQEQIVGRLIMCVWPLANFGMIE